MSLQQIKKEIQVFKETVKDRPLKVLLQTKAKDMTTAEIDRLVQKVPIREVPTDVLVSYLDRDIGEINEYLGTSFNSVAGMPIDMYEKMTGRWKNESAVD